MKRIIAFSIVALIFISLNAQLKNVIVEKYYISDVNDAKDIQYFTDDFGNVTDTLVLEEGSTTYRIYIQIARGYMLTKLYGDINHALKISSTSTFYNHVLGASYGKDISNARLKSKTLALDSWLTLGMATKTKFAVLKSEDKDGSIIGGSNSAGFLVNKDTSAGIPLTTADGLTSIAVVPTAWLTYGVVNSLSGADSTIFGTIKKGNLFSSNVAFIQNAGVTGVDTGSNKVLVAQLTTKGDISFELNIQVQKTDGSSVINYVARKAPGDAALGNIYSLLLSYPQVPVCGCKDLNYMEYNPIYDCNNMDSCKTKIVFGCMDPKACNYDSNANYPLNSLCCYPGSCADRDISIVCPDLGSTFTSQILLYPNPAKNNINIEVSTNKDSETKFEIYNSFGRSVLNKNLGIVNGTISSSFDVSSLENGIYMIRFQIGDKLENKIFIKGSN
jgi:hypothetical protein